GHKPQVELVSQYGAQNEPARIYPGNQIKSLAHVAVDEQVNQNTKSLGVLKHGGDISENHTRFGTIGHTTYRVTYVDSWIDMHETNIPDRSRRSRPVRPR